MDRQSCALARRSFHVEQFESRQMMAGNVTVGLIDGSLFIDGDDEANGIAIVATENPGEFRVTGTPAFAGDVTELNEQDGPLTFVVTKDIVIRLGAGNDGVELNDVNVPRNLTIETGDGLDRISLGSLPRRNGILDFPTVTWPPSGQAVPGMLIPDARSFSAGGGSTTAIVPPLYTPLDRTPAVVNVGRNLAIVTGDASDYVFLGNVRITGDAGLRTGDGDDVLLARAVSARKFDAGAGNGADLVNISDLTTRGQLTLETGFGNDFVSFAASHAYAATTFLGGHGDNQFFIATSVFSGSLYAEFGIDNDRVVIKTSMLLGNANIVTSGGGDRLDIDYCFGRFVGITTGAQNDLVSIRGSALDNVFAHLGDGDDQLWLTVSRILYPLYTDGGAGGNDLINEYGSFAYFSFLSGFEHQSRGYPWWQTS